MTEGWPSEYGVKSRTLNLGGENRAKGYAREDLYDAWRRYLQPLASVPDRSVTSVTSVTSVPETDFQRGRVTDVTQAERSVTDDKAGKSANKSTDGTLVTDVTDVAGGGGEEEVF
jgi:hypothetical protein